MVNRYKLEQLVLFRLKTKLVKLYNQLTTVAETVEIDDRSHVVKAWELLEDGPSWILDLDITGGPRWYHAGETLDIVTPHQTALEGQVVACRTSAGRQRLVIKGHGSSYVEET
jgi:hypothetical protein